MATVNVARMSDDDDDRELMFIRPIQLDGEELGFTYTTSSDPTTDHRVFFEDSGEVREGAGMLISGLFVWLPDALQVQVRLNGGLLVVKNPDGKTVGAAWPVECETDCKKRRLRDCSVVVYRDTDTELVIERVVSGEVVGREIVVEGPKGYDLDLHERLGRAFAFHYDKFGGHRPIR